MKNQLRTKIYNAAVLTFEEMGFMFPVTENEAEPPAGAPEATVCVQFNGPFSGGLVIKAYGGLLAALAANMLGESDTPSEQQQLDALGEVANVICGNLLPSVAGTTEVFDLGTPSRAAEIEFAGGWASSTDVHIALDQGSADVLFYIDGEVPALKE